MKKELLSPVGNMDSLKMAIYHGADAVYLGGKRFGARAFAANFSEEEMKEAIFLCHLYGVKIYVTVNTMIYESELEEAIDYVRFLYLNHVDAVIMADIGLMKLCHELFPDLEIHASTQVHTHNVEQVKILKKLGVKRVVVARELSLEEIQQFPNDLELEVFIHGALCISYSGQCLFSSLLLHRSGNRGECAQICRLPFTLLQNGNPISTNGQYLLSTRDLNTTQCLKSLLDSSIKSFKIEGRMKSPAYVGFMTQLYRRLMDEYEEKRTCSVSSFDTKCAEVLFGRGFTEGCLFRKKDDAFMNQKTSNHQGVVLGKIESISSKKIGIRLEDDVHQEDGIRFVSEDKGMILNFLYDEKGLLISEAVKGELVFVDNKLGISKKGIVTKTLDSVLEKNILSKAEKKIPVTMKASISLNGFTLEVTDGIHIVSLTENIVEHAKNYPITEEKIREQLGKLGSTPYILTKLSISMENQLFVNVKDMNELRRKVVEELTQKRVWREKPQMGSVSKVEYSYDDTLELFATARNEEQLKTLLDLNLQGIYVDDYSLYQKYQNMPVIYRTNRVQHHVIHRDAKEILAGESGGFVSHDGEKSIDYFGNVANHATADFWTIEGAKRICLTPEMDYSECVELLNHYPKGNPFEQIIYGRLEVMVLNHCILRMNVNQEKVCQVCKGNDRFALQDRNGAVYPIVMDEFHHTHLFHCQVFNLISDVMSYYKAGICKFRLEFFDETEDDIKRIVNQLKIEMSKYSVNVV